MVRPIDRLYWIGMALCGEGLLYTSSIYFERDQGYPIRVTLYPTSDEYWGNYGGMWGYVDEVPFIGY